MSGATTPLVPASGSISTAEAPRCSSMVRPTRAAASVPHSAAEAEPNGQRYAYGGGTWATPYREGSACETVRASPLNAIAA